MTGANFFGLLGYALAVAALAATLLRRRRTMQVTLVLVAAAVMFLPYQGLPAAAYVRGALGDLSVTTMLLLAIGVVTAVSGWQVAGLRERGALLAAVALMGLVLYPLALGLGDFDPYALGYGSAALLALLGVAVLAAWFAHWHAIVVIVTLAIAAQLAGALDSQNLWDYLIDPLLWFYALGWWGVELVRRRQSAYK